MKKTRSRLKSTTSESQAVTEEQMANSNGGKSEAIEPVQEASVVEPEVQSKPDEVPEDESVVSEDTNTPADEVVVEKPVSQGRKRKASELKATESDNEESQGVEKVVVKVEVDSESSETKSNEKDESRSEDIGAEGILDSSSDISAMKQLLGKGKRARIPNKRYSDFPLKSTRGSSEPMEVDFSKENGEKENVERESGSNSDLNKGDVSEHSSSTYSSPNVAVSAIKGSHLSQVNSPSTPAKKQKLAVDLTNPIYLKPFKFGWKRELVYRTTNDNNNKRNGDIYYYTPTGKKVRSMREVSENLKNKELSLEDFTFFKEPLGLDDPEKEIIRDAKVKSGTSTPASKKSTPKPVKKVPTPAVASPKVVAPPLVPEVVEEPKAKNSPRLSAFKIKLGTRTNQSTKGKQTNKKKEKDDADLEIGNWSTSNKKASKSGTNDKNKPCQPCSIRCQGVAGLIPNLQCRICLCLYHNECVGLAPNSTIQGYVCKNCQLDQDTSTGSAVAVAPPPLTPINTLKSVTTQSLVLPKLQRIPRLAESTSDRNDPPPDLDTLPPLTPRPNLTKTNLEDSKETNIPNNENRSLVGSVTTWFASSSTIQLNPGNNYDPQIFGNLPTVPPPRPQYVEFLGNKQFLVVPKHNIVSISPTITPSAPITIPNSRPLEAPNISENAPLGENQTNVSNNPGSANLGATLTNEIEISQIKSEPFSPTKAPMIIPSNEFDGVEGTSVVASENVADKSSQLESDSNEHESAVSPKKTRRSVAAAGTISSITNRAAAKVEDTSLDNYLQSVAFGYSTLLHVFQYLKVQDLLRAGCVCSMWRDMASHSSLWKTVRMKNSQIHSFKGLANALEKHGTVHLDLRKMLLPSNSNDEIWQEFTSEIKKVDSLKKIELCRCPAVVVEQLAMSNPKLEVVNAVTIKCESMNIAPISYLPNLQELRLKSTSGFSLSSNLTALAELKHLKHLSLTSIRDLNELKIIVIADLQNLESLDLGECVDFPRSFGSDILSKLVKLEKLRLEKGQGNCYTFEILEAVKNMKQLEQLELVNFDIKTGFDRALGACTNIKKLLIIPTYISQSATTNHMVLGGVLRLQATLSHFVWGVTLELLRVTELFVDQCEDPEKKEKKEKKPISNGDSIPVLKPVPLLRDGSNVEIPPAQDPPQVEILPLPNLQKLLLQSLPTTRVKILKIPFHATWRQSITDTVN